MSRTRNAAAATPKPTANTVAMAVVSVHNPYREIGMIMYRGKAAQACLMTEIPKYRPPMALSPFNHWSNFWMDVCRNYFSACKEIEKLMKV